MIEKLHSAERLNLILESTLEGWWEWDVVQNTSYHSPRWYEMLGYQKTDFPNTFNVWKELMHPDDQEHIIDLQQNNMQNSDSWEMEFRMRCKNGDYKWILSRGRVIKRSNAGEAEKLVGIHLDITERKKNEQRSEEYRRQEELLKGIIKVFPATFKVYDFLQKKMIYSSHLGAKFLHYPAEEFERFAKEKNFIEQLIHPDDLQLVEDSLYKLIHSAGNDIIECFFRLKRREGNYTWIKTLDWVSKRSENGTVEEIIGSIQDVSRYKQLDEKMNQSIKVLETLSYKNSHLVRGPVSSILGLTDLIKTDLSSAGIDSLLITHLERTVIKLDEVIRDFNNTLSDQLDDIS